MYITCRMVELLIYHMKDMVDNQIYHMKNCNMVDF